MAISAINSSGEGFFIAEEHSDYYEESIDAGYEKWVGDPPEEDDFNSNDFKTYCILDLNTSGLFECKRAIALIRQDLAERKIKPSKRIEFWIQHYTSKLYAAWFVDNLTLSPDEQNFERVLKHLKMDVESSISKKKR